MGKKDVISKEILKNIARYILNILNIGGADTFWEQNLKIYYNLHISNTS
jgi:hypothetical protein